MTCKGGVLEIHNMAVLVKKRDGRIALKEVEDVDAKQEQLQPGTPALVTLVGRSSVPCVAGSEPMA